MKKKALKMFDDGFAKINKQRFQKISVIGTYLNLFRLIFSKLIRQVKSCSIILTG